MELPERKIFALMILISLIMPAHYLLLAAFPPEGHVFTGGSGSEDGARFFLMKSPYFDFKNPWDTTGETSVLHNPLFNSPALYVPSGLLFYIFDNPLFVFSALRFAFTLLLLIVSFNIIKIFVEQKHVMKAFLIFVFGSGIGGIIYLVMSLFQSNFFTSPYFAFLYDITRSGITFMSTTDLAYWTAAISFGYLSLLMLTENKYNLSGLFLGASFLIHLTLGAGFAFLLVLYALIFKTDTIKLFTSFAISAPFALTWLILYIQEPFFFDWYKVSAVGSAFAPSLLIGTGVLGILAFYYMHKRGLFDKLVFIAAFILITAAKLAQLIVKSENAAIKTSLGQLTDFATFLHNYSAVLHLPMIGVLLLIIYKTYKSNIERNEKFILITITGLITFVLLPEGTIFSGRYFIPLWLPLSIAAVYSMKYIEKDFKIDAKKITVAIILISLPSIIIYNVLFQQIPRYNVYPSFYHEDEFRALQFLKQLPEGNVICSFEIGSYMPYYSHKKTLFGAATTLIPQIDEKTEDYAIFYGNATDEERMRIIEKYKIRYVFFGVNERKLSGNWQLLDGKSYLDEIYSAQNAKIYEVKPNSL